MKISKLSKNLRSGVTALALCALALTARAQYSNAVLGLNPILYYHLNDTNPVPGPNWVNVGTAGPAGTMFGLSAPYFRQQPGPLVAEPNEYAAGFISSVGNYGEIPYSPAMDPSKGNPQAPFTVEGWYLVGGNSALDAAVSFGNGSVPNGWCLFHYPNSSGWVWQLWTGKSAYLALLLQSGTELTPGQWYHVVLVWDGANASMYVDGALVAGPTPAPTFAPMSESIFAGVGILAHSYNYKFSGEIAELAVYTNVLSSNTIAAHYQNATNTAPAQTYESLVMSLNPLLYYRFADAGYTSATPGVEPAPFQPGQPLAMNLGTLGTNYDATYEPGTTVELPGAPCLGFGTSNNFATLFDGLDEMAGNFPAVAIPPLTNFTSVSNFTFTCWFYPPQNEESDGPLMMQRTNGGGLSTGVAFSTSLVDFYSVWNANNFRTNFGLPFAQDAWSFLAAVWTPSNVTLYLNGVPSTLTGAETPHNFNMLPITLGADSVYNLAFIGQMQEVAMYTNALEASDISNLMAAAAPLPQITNLTQSPLGPTNYDGQTITFSVGAFSATSMTFKWLKNNLPLAGQTGTNLVLTNALTTNSGNYSVAVSNTYGAVTSSVIVLNVVGGIPFITEQPTPAAATRSLNGTVTFTAAAVGAMPITYQWWDGSTPISGATTASLTLSGLQAANAGSYYVVFSNSFGTNTSSNAVLTMIGVATNYASALVALGPSAYWRLNETSGTNAFDYIGGNTGTIVGGVTLDQPGAVYPGLESSNTSFTFDGASGVVDTPLLINGFEGTFTALVNVTSETYVPGIMVARGGAGGCCGFGLYTNGLTLQYIWGNVPGTYDYEPTVYSTGLAVTPDTWCFVVVSVGSNQTIIYVDDGSGLLSETNNEPSVYVTNTGPLLIGYDNITFGGEPPPYFTGGLDECAYFNRALSPAEVTALDNTLKTGAPFGAPSIAVQPAPQTVFVGSAVSFSVDAVGAWPFTYQWQFNTTNILGATGQTLVIPSAALSNAGSYTVVVSNSISNATSLPAQLTVLNPPVPNIPGNVSYGLVGHYKFDGDCTDSSGHGHNGTPFGSPTFVPGKIGSGAIHVDVNYTNSIHQFVALGDPTDFQFNPGDSFSVSLWLNYSNSPGDLPIIGNSVNSTYQPGWVIADGEEDGYPGQLELSFVSGGGDYTAPAAYPLNDGNWHHVAMVANLSNNIAVVYVDGVLLTDYYYEGGATVTTTAAIPAGGVNPGYQMAIGSDPEGNYQGNVPGGYSIDDVGIWHRALTSAEVAGIYAAGTNGNSFSSYGPVQLTVRMTSPGQLQLSWPEGTLWSAPALTGPWTQVAGASPQYYVTTPGGTQLFYRVQ